jgi:hypothetical protein
MSPVAVNPERFNGNPQDLPSTNVATRLILWVIRVALILAYITVKLASLSSHIGFAITYSTVRLEAQSP